MSASLAAQRTLFFCPAQVLEKSVLYYYHEIESDPADRIQRRLKNLRLADCSSYLNLLNSPGSMQKTGVLVSELALGADGCIEKRKFDQENLLDTVRQML